jgi:H+-transporting ATPase
VLQVWISFCDIDLYIILDAVNALKDKLQITARVLRDGSWKVLPARELVPSDVVRIRTGDFVPAGTKR